jgi:hypothetical protein
LDDPSAGNVVTGAYGIYGDTVVGLFYNCCGPTYGFSETGGVYTTLDDPSSVDSGYFQPFTYAQGIYGNTVVGGYIGIDGYDNGFEETGGVYTTVDVPGATATSVFGIYGTTLVGEFNDEYNGSPDTHGFIASPTPEPASFSLIVLIILGCMGLLALRRRSA